MACDHLVDQIFQHLYLGCPTSQEPHHQIEEHIQQIKTMVILNSIFLMTLTLFNRTSRDPNTANSIHSPGTLRPAIKVIAVDTQPAGYTALLLGPILWAGGYGIVFELV